MSVSLQTQAVMLLTVHFEKTVTKPLSIKEWARFALWLRDHKLEPSQLLKKDPKSLLSDWKDKEVTLERVEGLLDRGVALGFALDKWQQAGLWIITRSESDYPDRLKRKLRFKSPPVLFGCGGKMLLNKGGIAVVGSRDADEDDLDFSSNLARTAADQGLSVVSGAARGVDESAIIGALEHGGTAVGVVANSLLHAVTSRKYREHLSANDLVLISPFKPEAGFNVGNAMARNKYIYCLSDAAVVVNSTLKKGGTWNGAIEDLKEKWVPLLVKPKDSPKSGNKALIKMGARQFPKDMPTLSTLWDIHSGEEATSESQLPLFSPETESASAEANITRAAIASAGGEEKSTTKPEPDRKSSEVSPVLYNLFLLHILQLTSNDPLKADEISKCLKLEKSQVHAWLKRGITDGQIKKINKPVRYQSSGEYDIDRVKNIVLTFFQE